MAKAVYIHIPFCRKICTYCDFCKFIFKEEWVSDYLERLKSEVEDRYMGEKIETVYIGGGTPSSIPLKYINELMSIVSMFDLSELIEFSFECNLEDINEDLLFTLKNHGVNRISIGVESFDPNNLKVMNRTMNYDELKNKMDLIRSKGINNINLDLMYALPHETKKTLKKDIKKLLSLNPSHISTYSLILEDNTYLTINKTEPMAEELDYDMYKYICKTLKKHGYEHYEISNFCHPGYESIHNKTYWLNEEYYGFGCGASGYIEGVRYDNTRSLSKYSYADTFSTKNLLSRKDIMDYEIILGMRLTKGINIKEFNEKYGVDIFNEYPMKTLIKYGDMIEKDGYIFINPDKLYVMNEILLKCV